MNLSWNKSSRDLTCCWERWCHELPLMKEAAQHWRDHLVSLGSLADNLLSFVKSKI
ncbi:MAG: elongation factor P maturation arginine rhamnosyltransferase EarP [Parasutterella excrementihominis]